MTSQNAGPAGELTPLPEIAQFEAWLKKWGPQLLPGWELGVRFVGVEELSDPTNTAQFCGSYGHAMGEVQICREQRAADFIFPETTDWETILVHELLHGVLDFPVCEFLNYKAKLQRILYERSINVLARALVTADRNIPAAVSAIEGNA